MNRNPLPAKGFTLLETIFSISIVAILSTIGITSWIAAQERAKLQGAVDSVVANLQIMQTEAMRLDRVCALKLTSGVGTSLEPTTLGDRNSVGCTYNSDRRLSDNIELSLNKAFDTPNRQVIIAFGPKGNTTNNQSIYLRLSRSPLSPRCIVISAPLALMRVGTIDRDGICSRDR
jgi:prepilin-type N-terminal cleavage/methylation domain-containing protein